MHSLTKVAQKVALRCLLHGANISLTRESNMAVIFSNNYFDVFTLDPPAKLTAFDEISERYVSRGLDETVAKLQELIDDRATCIDNKPWIDRLLHDFLHHVRHDGGYKVRDLPRVMQLLEFLASRAHRNVYEIHLRQMLKLCALPPLLQTSFESLRCEALLQQYFTFLGYLVAVLPNNESENSVVLQAIARLLVQSKPCCASAVKPELCLKAAEESRLPVVITQLVEISSLDAYPQLLKVVLLLTTKSHSCCYRMLEAGILNHLLIKMDPSNWYRSIDDTLQGVDESTEVKNEPTCLALATNIAGTLMRSILFLPGTSHRDAHAPLPEATRSLQNAFRRQVRLARGNSTSLSLRNDLTLLILTILTSLPAWCPVGCGLAEDLVILAVAAKTGIKGTWTEKLTFGTSNEDLVFRKMIISILFHLSNHSSTIAIMTKWRVIPMILELVDGPNGKTDDAIVSWSPAQIQYLSQFAMRTLAPLALKMPREFVLFEGTIKLTTCISEWSMSVKFDAHLVVEFARAMCSIVSQKCPIIMKDFRDKKMDASLTKLVDRTLTFDRSTTQLQRIQTLLITSIEEVIKTKDEIYKRKSNVGTIGTVKKLLQRCLNPSMEDCQLDQRLLIAIGSYIWNCILPSPEDAREFVDDGGIYTILEVTQKAKYSPVSCIYLGILVDVLRTCSGKYHELRAWRRGTDETRGIASLLAELWREEEIQIGAKRNMDGCIEDIEVAMMGQEQWFNTFHGRRRASHDSSPALASMLGSLRPKIFAIRKMMKMTKTHENRYEIPLDIRIPAEDAVTLSIADHFYRFAQGQVWNEITRYLEQVGVKLLELDGETLFLMNQRHHDLAVYVRGIQTKLLKAERNKEINGEREEIWKIRHSKLGRSLNALADIDYIRRTTEREYAMEEEKRRRSAIESTSIINFQEDKVLSPRRNHDYFSLNNPPSFQTILEHNPTISHTQKDPVN